MYFITDLEFFHWDEFIACARYIYIWEPRNMHHITNFITA